MHLHTGSMNDIWLPLVKGASSNVVPREVMLSPSSFEAYIKHHGLTLTFLTPKVGASNTPNICFVLCLFCHVLQVLCYGEVLFLVC